jgi:autotransporter passenger strand-loop-strand repeat protein
VSAGGIELVSSGGIASASIIRGGGNAIVFAGAAMYDLTAAIYRATAGLVGACPAEDSFTALGRLDAKQRQLEALRKGIDAIQPVLSKFEDSLNDSQRTRLAIAVTG